MQYLVIAPPRTGKSQLMAKTLWEHKQAGKRVFVTNFNQTSAQREATGFECYGDDGVHRDIWEGDVSKWFEELPHGAVWMIDEAQDVIPQRGKSTVLPQWVKLFSKHGHKDLTIYVVTQDAMQVDVHLRRNANITWYMTRPLNMKRALIYTFRGSQDIPNDAWRRLQVLKSAESKKKFKYSKKWQDMYVSASSHDHIRMRFPLKLLIPVVATVIVAALLLFAWHRLKGQAKDTANPASAAAAAVIGARAPTAAAVVASGPKEIVTADDYNARFTPRVARIPSSAPAYDGFEVTDYPRAYCYVTQNDEGEDVCKCITQQGSKLPMEPVACLDYVQNGYFDPFQKQPESSPSGAAPQTGDSVAARAPVGIGDSSFRGQQNRYGQMRDQPIPADYEGSSLAAGVER